MLQGTLLLQAVSITPALAAGEELPADEAAIMLDSVTVTARKRGETEFDVPISMGVIREKQAELIPPASSNANLARMVPNFNFLDSGGQYTNAGNIRGVGSFSPLSSDDTSIVFNVDEIPLSAYGVPPVLMDIERVEVLRGPQGTLYGRNTQGGAINIVTNRPQFGPELSVRMEGGSRDYGLGELIVNDALNDNLAGRLAIRYSEQNGDVRNNASGDKDGAAQIGALRGSLLFVPDEETSALLTLSYNRNDDQSPRFILRDSPGFPRSGLDPRNDFRRESYGLNLRVSRALDWANLESLSSIQYSTFKQKLDMTDSVLYSALTGLSPAAFDTAGDLYKGTLRDTALMQELRLSSLEDGYLQWVTGINLWYSEFDANTKGLGFTQPRFAVFSGSQKNRFRTLSSSTFGEATLPLTERLKGTLGLRLTHEGKRARYRYQGGDLGTVPTYGENASVSDNFVSGRAALNYEWSPQWMTYISVGRGVVGQDFPWSSSNVPFGHDEEAFATSKSWTYEAGFKSRLWDERLQLNGSVFYNDVEDGHLYVYNGVYYQSTTLDYDSSGAELEVRLKLTDEFNLSAGVGYTHAELKNVSTEANRLTRGAKEGNQVPNVPEYSGNLGLEYRISAQRLAIPSGELYGNVSYQYVDKRAADVANSFNLGSYDLTNARIGWEDSRYGIYLFGYNLFDKRYESVGAYYSPEVQAVRVGQGRIAGVGLTAKL
ncbi:TonB-dependent receptor [Azorhizophilus paspali]|uniref:TonB-dependent receptor n=1 Tax=Azorhizophilus paspali TaxID=69963 RepID=A0ABV6SJB1_AZOPA